MTDPPEYEPPEDDYWFEQDMLFCVKGGRHWEREQVQHMTFPARCTHCNKVYDLGKVEVVARYADCSMWHCPGCGILADDRKPPWGVKHYEEIEK